MKKDNLKFYDNVKPITMKEYKHWRRLLPKILKVGAELEYNLQKQTGKCKGYSDTCFCGKHQSGECVPECVYLSKELNTCKLGIKNMFNCKERKEGCNNSKCDGCENFVFECDKVECVHYIPECLICETLINKCSTCPNKYDPYKTPDILRQKAETELFATQSFGRVGKFGVLQVVPDGSLENNGLEVPTVGRRLNFDTFKEMFKRIIEVVTEKGGYIDSRCSFHVHVLNEYYTKTHNNHGSSRHPDSGGGSLNLTSLEKNMPNIILTNIIQLWRMYETSFYWMGCGLSFKNNITRWEKFRVSMLQFSPISNSLSSIVGAIGSLVGKQRYGSLNMCNTKFDGSRLHLEFRVCDMVNSQSYMAAMCCLFYALIIKAVDISCYGLLNVEDSDWITNEMRVKNSFVNGVRNSYDSERISDTSNVYKHADYLVNKSNELIELLSPTLAGFDPAEKILRKIANKPVALRLLDVVGEVEDPMNKYNIEKELEEETDIIDDITESILRTVAVGKISHCSTSSLWINEVSEDSKIPQETIEEHVNSLVTSGEVYWNKSIGSYLYR